MKRRGFTLVELIVVIAIIIILAALAIPTLTKYVSDAKDTTRTANFNTVYEATQMAIVEYMANGGEKNKDVYNNTGMSLLPIYVHFKSGTSGGNIMNMINDILDDNRFIDSMDDFSEYIVLSDPKIAEINGDSSFIYVNTIVDPKTWGVYMFKPLYNEAGEKLTKEEYYDKGYSIVIVNDGYVSVDGKAVVPLPK